MTRKTIYAFIPFIGLLIASLACSIFVGGPDYPETPVSFSMDSLTSLNQQFEQSMAISEQTGSLTLQINESQLTSYLILKLQTMENPPLSEPQVLLRDGQMQIYGKVTQGVFVANTAIIINVGIDEAGLPKIEVASAEVGPFPAPDGVRSAITDLISEAYTGTLGPVATGFRLENVSIADGNMTLTGRIK